MRLLFLCLIHPIPLVASISFLNSNKQLINSIGLLRRKSRTVRRCDSSPVHTAKKEFSDEAPFFVSDPSYCTSSKHFILKLQQTSQKLNRPDTQEVADGAPLRFESRPYRKEGVLR
ncbi:hypothetical protein C7460_12333 [Marinoscillum furvescens DSM 4134]|uniref:Uncharacterized protein n=1 Tax=Marinoscillum furvescens DSM 4134 TaxID=1122208 RepID=A0A3D9KXN3_MARFU|nr:hypothetical protein C7460_12333 [Marinoscillum furvescens DSM 4134]